MKTEQQWEMLMRPGGRLVRQDGGRSPSLHPGAVAGTGEAREQGALRVSPSQPRPWRPRPSISEVQRRHLVGDGKLRGRSVCEPGWRVGKAHYPGLTLTQGPQAPPWPPGHPEVQEDN